MRAQDPVANTNAPSGKVLALDVGLARIGVAVCDPLQIRARPLTVVQRGSRREDFDLLAALVRKEEVHYVVCGLPLNMDGSEGPQARYVRKWALRLAHALRALLGRPMPILFWDERLTTVGAGDIVEQGAALSIEASTGEDAVAAALILQRYLERGANLERPDFGTIMLPEKQARPAPAVQEGLTL
jgi:putative Holliday junction resolvase